MLTVIVVSGLAPLSQPHLEVVGDLEQFLDHGTWVVPVEKDDLGGHSL